MCKYFFLIFLTDLILLVKNMPPQYICLFYNKKVLFLQVRVCGNCKKD
ncbi:MAG: hypothetical protein RL757_2712 [Bacteroidota bacterium]|jgi:hypothetical protein